MKEMPLVQNLYQGPFSLLRKVSKGFSDDWAVMDEYAVPTQTAVQSAPTAEAKPSGRRDPSTCKELEGGHVVGQRVVWDGAGAVGRARLRSFVFTTEGLGEQVRVGMEDKSDFHFENICLCMENKLLGASMKGLAEKGPVWNLSY